MTEADDRAARFDADGAGARHRNMATLAVLDRGEPLTATVAGSDPTAVGVYPAYSGER